MLIGIITEVYYLSEREVLRTKTVGKSNILYPALFSLSGLGSVVGKAIGYGLDGPGIESR